MEWIVTNWELIGTLAVFLIGLLNVVTTHWSGHAGLMKWGLFLTEILSFLASKDVPGLLKLPLTSKAPGAKTKLPLPILLAGFLLMPSCGSWQQTVKSSLDLAGTTAVEARTLVRVHYTEKCEGEAMACAKAKTPACPKLVACQMERGHFYTTLKAIHLTRVAGYGAVTLGNEEDARAISTKVIQSIGDLYKAFTKAGVL